jgi:hypothetical protein
VGGTGVRVTVNVAGGLVAVGVRVGGTVVVVAVGRFVAVPEAVARAVAAGFAVAVAGLVDEGALVAVAAGAAVVGDGGAVVGSRVGATSAVAVGSAVGDTAVIEGDGLVVLSALADDEQPAHRSTSSRASDHVNGPAIEAYGSTLARSACTFTTRRPSIAR